LIKGCIFDIERFAVHDGPGIRDVIFMKGCPLKCAWCCNPEAQDPNPEIFFNKNKCIGFNNCGDCITVCSEGAIIQSNDEITIKRKLCNNCGECADICPSKALIHVGKYYTVEEVIAQISTDFPFFTRSGGGVTISGGEPLFQCEFVSSLLKKLKDLGIHTTIETSGHGTWDKLEKIAYYTDLIYYDIKHLDTELHKIYTGVSNELILENIKKLEQHYPDVPIIVRTPVINGFNSTESDIKNIIDYVKKITNVQKYELMPYHSFGESKYYHLDRDFAFDSNLKVEEKHMQRLKDITNQIN